MARIVPARRTRVTDTSFSMGEAAVDGLTFAIAEYAASLSFGELPPDIVHAATQRLVDALGCAVGAYGCEQARIGLSLAPKGETSATNLGWILGTDELSSADAAAFINTALIRNLDFNDFLPGGHPSDSLGALLAVAGASRSSGSELLTSMVVAYEVFVRFTEAAKLRNSGWDQGYAMTVATAAGLGNLLGLSREVIGHAIAIVAVAGLPLKATRAGRLSLWKGAATALAARNAVFATLLASEGMTGPDMPFEGRHGLWEKATGPFQLSPFGGRGGEFLTPTVRIKYWPVEGSAQAAVWAALDLRSALSMDEVEEVEILTDRAAWIEIGSEAEKWDPQTRETADHSLPYIFARTLVDGTINLGSFEEPSYRDPSLRPLMARIQVRVDDRIDSNWPTTNILRVEAKSTHGTIRVSEIVNPPGHAKNPLGDGEISRKFRSLSGPVLGSDRVSQALDRWWNIGRANELGSALRLLCP